MYSWSNTNITWSNIVQYTLPVCPELLANYCSVDEEIKQGRFMYSKDARFHRSRRTRANDIQTIEKQERCMSINTSNPFSPFKSVIIRQTTFSRRDRSPCRRQTPPSPPPWRQRGQPRKKPQQRRQGQQRRQRPRGWQGTP